MRKDSHWEDQKSNSPATRADVIYILVINAGSTSTKVSIYKNDEAIINESINHPLEELHAFYDLWDQYDYRKSKILSLLEEENFLLARFNVIACRCGTTKPVHGGIYSINPAMLRDMKSQINGSHAASVGSHIAFDLAQQLNIPAVTVDPPLTDEMGPLAKYSGIPQIQRKSSFHALNQKATARKIANRLGKPYEQLNLIIVHLGGGISIGTHQKGKVIDVNNALDGDGPFSPERSGSLPTGELIDLCFSGQYTREEMYKLICGKGGLMAYLGTTDILEIEKRIHSGDEKAREVLAAMAYQTAKEIGAAAVVLEGKVNAIALTGNLSKSQQLTNFIKKKTSFIAPIYTLPGENEMETLAMAALRFLRGQEQSLKY